MPSPRIVRSLAVAAVLTTAAGGTVTTVSANARTGATTSAAATTTTLRLDGIGPLKLGMTRTAALRTGWLSNPGKGCELGGPPLPVVYRLKGKAAPSGVSGTVQFDRGKLTVMSFDTGVTTAANVTVGVTTVSQMVARYRAKGLKAKATFDSTFGGTFVEVSRTTGGQSVIGAFAAGKRITSLALPTVPVCE